MPKCNHKIGRTRISMKANEQKGVIDDKSAKMRIKPRSYILATKTSNMPKNPKIVKNVENTNTRLLYQHDRNTSKMSKSPKKPKPIKSMS